MDNFNINNLIAVVGLIFTILTALAGAILYYVNSEKRKYGLERDFAHLKRNHEQISQSLGVIITEIDHRFDAVERSLIEIKSILNIKK